MPHQRMSDIQLSQHSAHFVLQYVPWDAGLGVQRKQHEGVLIVVLVVLLRWLYGQHKQVAKLSHEAISNWVKRMA